MSRRNGPAKGASIEFEAVTKGYGGVTVLDHLTLTLRPGQVLAFLGHNGAGKTTALRVALGLVRPSSGGIVIDGFDARRHPREARARLGGLVEVPGFHGAWSARANLVGLGRLAGLPRDRSEAEAERVLALVGLVGVGAKRVDAFSHGMRQRLGIAAALLGGPRYLLLDEPLNGLDPEGVAEMRALFVRLARDEGIGILVSSHQLAEVAGFATHVAILRRGELLHAGPMAELLESGVRRHRVVVRAPERAEHVFARRRLAFERASEDGAYELDVGASDPEELLAELVRDGARPVAIAPRPASLEEFYLRAQAAPPDVRSPDDRELPTDPPSERRAPPRPRWRVARYELQRLLGRGRLAWILLLPPLVGLFALAGRVRDAAVDRGAVEGRELFSATRVTAFEGVGVTLAAGLPVLALVLCGLASQSLAGELARGTLRNVLLRPVERGHVVLGKALALVAWGVFGYALLLATAFVASAAWLDFGDVGETLPNGTTFVLTPASELWPELVRAVARPVLPLCAFTLVGFACGALVRGAAAALALAFGTLAMLDLARLFLRGSALEAWLPGAHLTSPLADTSGLAYFLELARGVSSARFAFESTSIWTPLLWTVLSLVVARAMLLRRDVP